MASETRTPYLFVGGSQRSGTNLTNTLLCQDPATNPMLHEAKYLSRTMSTYAWARRQLPVNTLDYFGDQEGLDRFHRSLLGTLLEQTRARHGGAPTLVLKDPELTPYFPLLHRLLPESRFVCMLRDPRDTIASMIKVGRRQAESGVENPLFADWDIPRLCRHYLSFYGAVLGGTTVAFRRRLLLISYEGLVSDPDRVLARLRDFTGLRLAVDPCQERLDTGGLDYAAASPNWRPWITEHYGRGVSRASLGRYAEVLDPQQVAVIEAECAPLMRLGRYTGSAG